MHVGARDRRDVPEGATATGIVEKPMAAFLISSVASRQSARLIRV